LSTRRGSTTGAAQPNRSHRLHIFSHRVRCGSDRCQPFHPCARVPLISETCSTCTEERAWRSASPASAVIRTCCRAWGRRPGRTSTRRSHRIAQRSRRLILSEPARENDNRATAFDFLVLPRGFVTFFRFRSRCTTVARFARERRSERGGWLRVFRMPMQNRREPTSGLEPLSSPHYE
jgi:hypothetical protein